MTATAGWYPDPGGQPGLFRYWDGRAWSAATTDHPAAAPPPAPLGAAPTAPVRPTYGPGQPDGLDQPVPRAGRRSPVGWVLGAVALVVVVALVVLGVRLIEGTSGPVTDPLPSGSPEAQCPPRSSPSAEETPPPADRAVSGKLSYPTLGAPFGRATGDSRVPFGRDVGSQSATVENAGTSRTPWAAGVVIATLTAGDGFYGPEQGAKLVARCVVGTFYGDNEVTRNDTRNAATTIDGKEAWLIESQLSYDIPDIRAKTELLIVVVIDTEDGNAGLFYGSVPGTAPSLVAPTREALAALRVA